jgi:hypothetical protein
MTNSILTRAKYLFFFLFLFAIKSSAQDISGIYSGTLINDSLKMVQNYELALSEYRGKITGYSYITFVANDTFYYGIKRIKATRQNGELVVEDVEMLANNYPKRPDKGVHVINHIPLPPGQDTILDMNGRWETTGTKKFYSISGALTLRRNEDSTQSPLIAHLTELKEVNYQDEKKNNVKNIVKTETKQKPKEEKREPKEVASVAARPKENKTTETKPVVKETIATVPNEKTIAVKEEQKTEQKQPQIITAEVKPKEIQPKETIPNEIVSAEQKINEKKSVAAQTTIQPAVASKPTSNTSNQVALTEKQVAENKPATSSNNINGQTKMVAVNTIQKPSSEQLKTATTSVAPPKDKEIVQQAAVKQPSSTNNSNTQSKEIKPVIATTIVTQAPNATNTKVVAEQPKTLTTEDVKISAAPSAIAQRASNTIQTLTVVSDSLILSFYDNGVVDGDSISVYLNNENIISSVKLKEAAVKKTIYINGRTDDMKLTLVADNLGSIPPNTGLLIIQDGNERYQIRFSADLQTNASVILRKK